MADDQEHQSDGGFQENLSSSSSSRPTFLNTFDPHSRYPIFKAFCDHLSIAEIVQLTRTCKMLSGLYQHLLLVFWDVDKALRGYFDDPRGFRSQMAKSGALICGDFATNYFERTIKKFQPLDVVVEQGDGSELINRYLCDKEGYVFAGTSQEGHIIECQTFRRKDESKAKIQLHTTGCQPIKSILLDCDATILISIVSWNKAYSVFALPTSIHYKNYMLKACVRFDVSRLGWKLQGVVWPEERRSNHPIRERRRIGDRYTWMIPFDTREVESSKTPDYVLEHACFKIDLSVSYDDNKFYHQGHEIARMGYHIIKTHALKSRVLKHTYLCTDTRMREFFLSRLHSSTMMELHKLAPSERPSNYDEIMENSSNVYNALEGFDPPRSWTYRDDDFPEWYKEFEKIYPEKS